MLNQSHCKLNTLKFQSHLLNWYKFIQPLYQKYVPSSIRHRRNIQHCKLDDVLVISLLCWQVELKITTQLRFYYFLQNNIFPKFSGSIINVGVRENSLASTFIFLQKKKHKYILFG
ncbi:MAG: hypothetical protein ACLUFR_09800 [Megamonas funiformis]|uniref:hypothetical protein n=1 Tax=Megamonas funiformis TaxID=437897 RepID=UPI0039942186